MVEERGEERDVGCSSSCSDNTTTQYKWPYHPQRQTASNTRGLPPTIKGGDGIPTHLPCPPSLYFSGGGLRVFFLQAFTDDLLLKVLLSQGMGGHNYLHISGGMK